MDSLVRNLANPRNVLGKFAAESTLKENEMEKGTHGNDQKTFEALDYAGQSRTLNSQIQVLQKGLKAHIRRGESENRDLTEMKNSYKEQLLKLITNLE